MKYSIPRYLYCGYRVIWEDFTCWVVTFWRKKQRSKTWAGMQGALSWSLCRWGNKESQDLKQGPTALIADWSCSIHGGLLHPEDTAHPCPHLCPHPCPHPCPHCRGTQGDLTWIPQHRDLEEERWGHQLVTHPITHRLGQERRFSSFLPKDQTSLQGGRGLCLARDAPGGAFTMRCKVTSLI